MGSESTDEGHVMSLMPRDNHQKLRTNFPSQIQEKITHEMQINIVDYKKQRRSKQVKPGCNTGKF